jgi:hypothetical protein
MKPDGLRSLLRRAARPLPERAQLLLKRADAALRQDDWAAPVKRLRLQERDGLSVLAEQNGKLPGRKQVLIFSFQQVPPWLEVEFSLGAALWLRGHVVGGIFCDGLLPLCEMNLGPSERPPCGLCAGWLARYQDAFGFSFSRLTDFVFEEDRHVAERQVHETPDHELLTLVVDGVGVGRLARRELQRYYRGFVFDPAGDPAYRRWLVSAVLLVRLVNRLLDRQQPDVVVTSSGRTLPSACLRAVAESRGIHVVTWDTEPSHSDGLVFSHNHAAVEIPLDAAWRGASRECLTGAQVQELREFLRRWARSEITPYPYNPAPLEDVTSIRSRLELRPGSPMVVAFTNSAWDMAVVDRDVGFASMFDWLFALVEYAVAHPGIDLVVRAHPSETNVSPDLQSRTPVGSEILKRYAPLPHNIKLVGGRSPVSSYALADMAQVVMVYASRIGLEVALRGKRPWLAGDMTYRGKGFTRDLTSRQEMLGLLDAGIFNDTLSADEIEMAERFAYLWFFRYVIRLPLLRPSEQPFGLRTFRDLAPGGHPVIDNLCEALVTGAPFVDLHLAATPVSGHRSTL